MKKEKGIIKCSAMTLLKGKEMVYDSFKDGIFSLPSPLRTDQSKKLERSSDYRQHFSPESNSTPSKYSLSNLDVLLFTPTRTIRGIKILTPS